MNPVWYSTESIELEVDGCRFKSTFRLEVSLHVLDNFSFSKYNLSHQSLVQKSAGKQGSILELKQEKYDINK